MILLSPLYVLLVAAFYRIRGQTGWAGTQIKRIAYGAMLSGPAAAYAWYTGLDPVMAALGALAGTVAVFLGLTVVTGHGAEQHYSLDHLMGDGGPSEMEMRNLKEKGRGWFQENADIMFRWLMPYQLDWEIEEKKRYKLAQAAAIGSWRSTVFAVALFGTGVVSVPGAAAIVAIWTLGYVAALELGKLVTITLKDPFHPTEPLLSPPNNELVTGATQGLAVVVGVLL